MTRSAEPNTSPRFEPIAIIGQSCTLPGALTPQALWANVLAAHSSIAPVPAGRWGVPTASVMGTVEQSADRTWSDRGGYVTGFRFDATGTAVPADELQALDPLFQMSVHGVREALRSAGLNVEQGALAKTGLVLGNLSFPSAAMARFAQSVWLDESSRPHPKNRFNSGLPAHLSAHALGLGGGAFALDAACASSLYAIKLACDRLMDGSADLMVAGAVNQADDLFIHVGFCALSALSKTGQSRPFHRDADGLVPAEGAGFVVLERLSDALAAGRKILGVIRGVGLSNDGRGRGLLAPSEEGQERALRLAYEQAGLSPADISLMECHATGTPVGDATELRSMARVFAGCNDLPIGSLKSNLGHLITAAGVAGLIKVLAAMAHNKKPPTLHADQPNEALAGTPFRVLHQAEDWTGPKRAGISAFGFGGNNAHLIVESVEETLAALPQARTFNENRRLTSADLPEIAIVGIGARVGRGEDAVDFSRELFAGTANSLPRETVTLALDGLRFPPTDLQQSLAQQTLVLEAARDAAHGLTLPRERTSVLVGMGCDAEVARYGARWRLANRSSDPAWLASARDGIVPLLKSSGVVGTMPNIPANRINSQLDLAGPAFTVSAEEASGITALQLAARALRAGEIDAALVGAVDLSHEPVHQAALAALGKACAPADAAVVLTLKRLDDARRAGDPVFALLGNDADVATLTLGDVTPGVDLATRFGKAHAANGLLHVAAAALALRHAARLHDNASATPWVGERVAAVSVSVLDAPPASLCLRSDSHSEVTPWLDDAPARLHAFSGANQAEAIASARAGRAASDGPARIVIVAASDAELATRREQACRWLEQGGPTPEGVAFRATPIVGDTAFVFTGAAAAYPGMGRELALALPRQVAAVAARCSQMQAATDWIYGPGDGKPKHPLDQLWGTSFVCQLHAEVTRHLLGLKPTATIGYSSGESNALFAMGAWNDLGEMMLASRTGSAFNDDLVGAFNAPRQWWQRQGLTTDTTWESYVVAAPVTEVRALLANEPLVRLTIINTADDCVIGGEAATCQRVVQKIGRERTLSLGYDMVAHCPEVGEIRDAWWALHHRAVSTAPDVRAIRFYTNATGRWYAPSSDAAAEAITGQALDTLDFPRTIEQAWQDGVRVFIEHGPRGLCSGWIRKILGEREHLVVPLDVAGRSGVRQLLNAAAWLVAAGVKADVAALEAEIARALPTQRNKGAVLTMPAHAPAPKIPAAPAHRKDTLQTMTPAPYLEPVLTQVGMSPPLPVVVSAPTAPPMAHRPTHTTTPQAATPMNDSLSRLVAQQQQICALHQTYLAQQAIAHAQFLALQQSAEAMLRRAYGSAALGSVTQGVAASPPVMQATRPTPVVSKPIAAKPAQRVAPPPTPPAPAPVPSQPVVAQKSTTLPGPKFDRAQLEVLAGGKISSVFGAQFAGQDGYARQVRMPEPPLLLADRVTGIDAVAGVLGKGTLWTETDVRADSWYLDDEGRMPAGVMIESGQADLLLISWMGIDALNKGERVYRLLGCELTYHGGLPVPGDTLCYDIHVDGHATQGDVRLFFFHYDCKVRGEKRLSVRNGQAGFFSDAELANSAGVLWDPIEEVPPAAQVDAPAVVCAKTSFSSADLQAFAAGRPFACFGAGWELTQPHVRSPRITSARMQFLHEVTAFDPQGGPWGRGYLRAETPVTPNDWFFKGHFKNDPCMPGTLMFEGCLQAMAIYLAALGYTIERDAWRFEPVPDTAYPMRCRGQVTPSSQHLLYEVFVSSVIAGPIPTLVADLLCTVDGKKAFHARGVGLRLVPDWPLEHWQHLLPAATQLTGDSVPLRTLAGLAGYREPKPVAVVDGFAFDYHSLLACAWGPPSKAFGPFYACFDGTRRAARLPGPPYHFMSRITKLDGPNGGQLGGMQPGTTVEVEYDVPAEQWYFEQNGNATMPFCVIMEAALQPCGWLASYVGSALTSDTDMLFRNLDGTGTLHHEILPGSGPFRTQVKILSVSQSAGMIIENFAVECFVGDQLVFDMKTVFGFFPKEAFENQVGLPASAEERAWMQAPAEQTIDLSTRPEKYCGGELALPGPMLLMLDRVTGYWPTGGSKGLGALRGEKTVDVDEWFFKAHFFQDPVQPGSLGVEALCQLLQFYMLEQGMGECVSNPRFEPLMLGTPVAWKYRGQVVPKNKLIGSELQISEVGTDAQGPFVIAEGWLWVDGKRIYHTKNLGMRIVSGAAPTPPRRRNDGEEILDPQRDTWLRDHCPTWTLPALPMMSMVDRLAAAVGKPVRSLHDVQVHRWLPITGPTRLRTEISDEAISLLAWRDAANPALSRFEPVASATFNPQVGAGGTAIAAPAPIAQPTPFAPLKDLASEPDPYDSGALFHGPAFQYLVALKIGSTGSSAVLRVEKGGVPRGALHQGLLDAATHALPHDNLSRWSTKIPLDVIGYPYRLKHLHCFADLPDSGDVQVEARFVGFDGDERFPIIDMQMIHDGQVLVDFRLVEILLPRGPIGAAPREQRRRFLRDRQNVPEISLSHTDATTTQLSVQTLRESDWLPGNMASLFAVPPEQQSDLVAIVAQKEHVARHAGVHPALVSIAADGARAATHPLRLYPLHLTRSGDAVQVVDAGPAVRDLTPVRSYWSKNFQREQWPVGDLFYGLAERFVGDVVLADPAAFARLQGRSCLYLANHQVGIESLLFSLIISGLSKTTTVTLAKTEHRQSWLGTLIAHSFAYPGITDPGVIRYFDRDDPASLPGILAELGSAMKTQSKSLMVHGEGTRALACRAPVSKLSSAFIDLALSVGAPIVPVRLLGGLPVTPLTLRLDFPVGYGRQDYWIGAPLFPEELAKLSLKQRTDTVINAMNALGPDLALEAPSPGDAAFAADFAEHVAAWQTKAGVSLPDAVLFSTLSGLKNPGPEIARLLAGAKAGTLTVAADAPAQWLGKLAQRLFGQSGPSVVGLQ
ncbi:MAG: beta keto-acyl synthase [Rhodocyclaceae bacterium]|nr:beta keto-acyl synthase [Rhodocyclaceae bacterium]